MKYFRFQVNHHILPPLYNKKYISKAKQNVANNDYADEEEEYDDLLENENISQANRDMYRTILEQELESKYIGALLPPFAPLVSKSLLLADFLKYPSGPVAQDDRRKMERTKITALFNMNFSDYHLTIKYIYIRSINVIYSR